MAVGDVFKTIKENEVKFVDLRFTDTKGKEQHVTVPTKMFDESKFKDGHAFDGSSIATGASGIGYSPPTVSAWLFERYGQNVTAFESETPAGQLAFAVAEPFTGFSGAGGL